MYETTTITTEAELVELLNTQLEALDGLRVWAGDSTPAAWATDRYELAIYVPRATSYAEVESILGYLWAGPMRGEWWPGEGETLIEGHLFVFPVDTTKSQRDDVPDAWDTFKGWMSEGTPVRATNRAGPGTKGTRAWGGLGPVILAWR